MNKNPLVSILVPTYNQVNQVEQTLISITSQSYRNVEIIVSDDASTDGTQNVLKLISAENDRIKLYLQDVNLGITKNYNFAVSRASGKYIAIFAGDDIMFPGKIVEQVLLLEENDNASFCHHAVEILDTATNESRGIISHKYKNGCTTIHDVLRNMGIPGSMSIMFRREIIEAPIFNPDIPTASDWLQMIHLTMAGRGLYINKPLCLYRRNSDYNGKDPSKYEEDFLRTIIITRCLYAQPGDPIDKSCDYALARYSLGAGFRRMIRGEQKFAREHFKVAAIEKNLSLLACSLYLLSYLSPPKIMLSLLRKYYKKVFPS